MCTVVILRRPGHLWPVLIAANRDEMRDRPWSPPARHWPDRAEVVAGRDELAGGSWLGINDDGVVAAIMNRPGSLGPAPGARSRGELVLEALDHADAADAAAALSHLDPNAYRPFNMLIADNRDAYFLRGEGEESSHVAAEALEPGLAMITSHDPNDRSSERIRLYLPRFEAARVPDPDAGDWADWERLLASRETTAEGGPPSAMNITTDFGFGTISSSLIALPAPHPAGSRPIWRFAAGPPDRAPFEAVDLKPLARVP